MDRVMIVSWQSGLVNTKESVLPVCAKPYHTNKKYRKGRRYVVKRPLSKAHGYFNWTEKNDLYICNVLLGDLTVSNVAI